MGIMTVGLEWKTSSTGIPIIDETSFYNLYIFTFPSMDLGLFSQQINQHQAAVGRGLMVVRPRYALLNYEEAFPSNN